MGQNNLGKVSAVLYDDIGDAGNARLVADEPFRIAQVISVLRISENSASNRLRPALKTFKISRNGSNSADVSPIFLTVWCS